MNRTVLGLDTSNYRTSIALVSEKGEILLNIRQLLPVPAGERGLRQNEAFFAHVKQLSAAADDLRRIDKGSIAAVAASTAPRDGTESYMPVFLAGTSFGQLTAAVLGVPFVGTTHQRGHLAAAKAGTDLEDAEEFLAVHLSGGTTDLLDARRNKITQIGGSLDLHAGQLVDRAGVAMGLAFPSGPEMEALAMQGESKGRLGCSMENEDLSCHLSGAESQVQRWIQNGELPRECIAREIYDFLARTVIRMLAAGSEKTGLRKALVTGGVAASPLLRELLAERAVRRPDVPEIVFGKPEMSGDNAVGVALIGLQAVVSG
ncbi:MAG: O-sialoglycoprotein endopeptidase [Clostridia bacterium]|nr:O-sialoglycoprotein endopeptidase [Clostridia bacterium]